MKCIPKLYRSLFNAVALALAFAAGTALAVDMPANYTRLDWIESDATNQQWIDSGYHPQSTTAISASILARANNGEWSAFWWVTKDDKGDTYAVQLRYYGRSSDFNGIFCNSSYGEARVTAVANGEYVIELKRDSLKVVGSQTTTKVINASGTPIDAPLYIFCENNHTTSGDGSDNARRYQPMRLYSMTISEGETLKRDFIPCIDNNGAYGLWDAVGGVFYGNKGTKADFTGGVVYTAEPNNTLILPSVSGMVELRGEDAATSEFEVQSVASRSLVYVPNDSKRVTIDSVGERVNIIVRKILDSDAPVTLALPAGQMIESLTIEDGLTVYLESGSVGSFEGTGRLVVQGAVGYGTISDCIDVKIESDASMSSILDDALASVLGDVPALWLDASDETTLQEYTYNGNTAPEGTFPGIVVRRWNDVRGGSDRYYAANARASTGNVDDGGYIRVMPYTMTNQLNGLTVMSFGTCGEKVTGAQDAINKNGQASGNGHDERRRLVFNKPITAKSVVMVYGSQDGGGAALIGGLGNNYDDMRYDAEMEQSQQSRYYYRGTTINDSVLKNTGIPVWLDGASVDPAAAKLSGGYQVLSLGVKPGDPDPSLRSLGMSVTYDHNDGGAGGQRYGEILIFTNELTTVQRKAVEFYLAKKWGLTAGFSIGARPRSLQIDEGGSFETFDRTLNGQHGTGTLSIGSSLEAGGVFSGSVAISSGAKLVVPASGVVLTEAEVDNISSKVVRFDPDCEDDIFFNNQADLGIRLICDHGKGGVEDATCLYGYYDGVGNDRRPVWSKSARGFGPERGWMDFYAKATSSDVKGDNLRFTTSGNSVRDTSANNNPAAVAKSIKTAFIVMDSYYGGGLPIIDKVSPDGSSVVRGRASYTDPTAPIWGSETSEILTNGETRINGIAVDGTKTGFTGAPELFSFTTDGRVFNAGVFGYYGGTSEKSYEVLGEIVLFSEVLDADTRGGVEAYLMKKWLGTLPPGYADWTGATVSGAGTVTAERPKDLPQFDNFTGTLEFTASTLAFTLDGATKTANEAFDIGDATLKLPAEGVISLSFKDGIVKRGTYVLGSFGSIAEPGIEGWTYPTLASDGKHKILVSAENGQLVARVLSDGVMIIVF